MGISPSRNKWRAEVFLGGRRVASQGGFTRKKDAQVWHDDILVRLRADPSALDKPTHQIEDLVRHFDRWHLPNVRATSQARYRVAINNHILPAFERQRLADITSVELEAFKRKLAERLKPRTANFILSTLKMLLSKAVRWRMLKVSPYDLDPIAVPVEKYEWWSEDAHIERFVAASRGRRYHGFYLLVLETGLRAGEAAGLSKGDIDFERGSIHVHRQWIFEAGGFGPTKHNRERWVSFDPAGELAAELRRWVESSGHPELVFSTKAGLPIQKQKVCSKLFKAVIKAAGVPMMKFHGTRHTFASWFMRRRGDIWALKEILGHADIKTTMRYAHHADGRRHAPLNLTAPASRTDHARDPNEGLESCVLEEEKAGGVTQIRTLLPLTA